MAKRKAPAGLGAPGRKLWSEVTAAYDLRPDEERMLAAACRTATELDELEKALDKAPVVTEGSQGQVRPHPLFAEVRAHRLALRQLLVAVGIEEAGTGDAGVTRSHAGRQLARQRWGQRGAA